MPNNSNLVKYMGKDYMLEGQYDDSHRVSLTEDAFKPTMLIVVPLQELHAEGDAR